MSRKETNQEQRNLFSLRWELFSKWIDRVFSFVDEDMMTALSASVMGDVVPRVFTKDVPEEIKEKEESQAEQ